MIHVESNIPFKYISWIIFLLRSNLSPSCYLFCGDRHGVQLSTACTFQSVRGKGSKIGLRTHLVSSAIWESAHQNPLDLLACI